MIWKLSIPQNIRFNTIKKNFETPIRFYENLKWKMVCLVKEYHFFLSIVMLQGGFEKNIMLVFTSPRPCPSECNFLLHLMHKFRGGCRVSLIKAYICI